jgi:hypothetical protein
LDYKPGMVVDPRRLWLERLGTSSDRQYKQADAQTNQSELQQCYSPVGWIPEGPQLSQVRLVFK